MGVILAAHEAVMLYACFTLLQMHMSHMVAGDNDGLQNWCNVTAAAYVPLCVKSIIASGTAASLWVQY